MPPEKVLTIGEALEARGFLGATEKTCEADKIPVSMEGIKYILGCYSPDDPLPDGIDPNKIIRMPCDPHCNTQHLPGRVPIRNIRPGIGRRRF